MKPTDIRATLKASGWSLSRDDTGTYSAMKDLDGRTVDAIPSLRRLARGQMLDFLVSVSTKEFSAFACSIFGEKTSHQPIVPGPDFEILRPDVTEADVRDLAQAILDWAATADIAAGLEAYRNLPTSAPGARPVWHLAALALEGDVARLTAYQASFRTGDRLGFVPYIEQDMIDRAVAPAQAVRDGHADPVAAAKAAAQATPLAQMDDPALGSFETAVDLIQEFGQGGFIGDGTERPWSGGAPESLIAEAEGLLGRPLPGTYRQFLRRFGAGRFESLSFLGLDPSRRSADTLDVVVMSRSLPARYVAVAVHADGTMFALDLKASSAGREPPVVRAGPDQRWEHVAEDFGQFMLDQIEDELNR